MIFSSFRRRRLHAADHLIDLLDEALVLTDAAHVITRFNRAAEKLLGWNAGEVVGKPLDVLIPARFHGQHGGHVDEFAHGPLPSRPMSLRSRDIIAQHKDGREIVLMAQIMRVGKGPHMQLAAALRPAPGENGDALSVHMTAIDALTGAYSRSELASMAAREVTRATRYHHPLSLLLLDLDALSAINDAHGAQMGDTVIKTFADMCAHTLRSVDVLGRWSDRAFVIILPETTLDGATAIAERLRRQTESLTFGTAAPVKATVSIGVTQYREGENALDAPLVRAEDAAREAKRQGRNRIITSR